MHPNFFPRCLFAWVLLFVTLFCIVPPCFAQMISNDMNSGMSMKMPINPVKADTNVQNGLSRTIDFNIMLKGQAAAPGQITADFIISERFWNEAYKIITPSTSSSKSLPTTESFFKADTLFKADSLQYLKSLVLKQLRLLQLEAQPEFDESEARSIPPLLPNNYLYTGAEVRTGDGKPVYSPVLGYGDNAAGFELTAEGYLPADGTRYNGNPEGLGISLKFNLGGLEQETQRHFQTLNEETLSIVTLRQLEKLLKSDRAMDNFQSIVYLVSQQYNYYNKPIPDHLYTSAVQNISIQYQNDLETYVNHITRPSASLLVSDQSFNGGGDISSEGAVFSKLQTFGYDKAGVLMTASAENFYDNLNMDDRYHEHSVRLGLSVIYQDRTPYLIPRNLTDDQKKSIDDSTGTPIQKYGFPWQYKIGVEYTSPILGLKDTYAVFVRYREPRHYLFDIILTYGADGAHKSYGNLSVGHIFTF